MRFSNGVVGWCFWILVCHWLNLIHPPNNHIYDENFMQTAALNNSSNKTRKPKWKRIQMYQDITHAHRIVCVYGTKKRVPKLRNCYEYNSKYVRHTAGEQTLVESHIVLSYVHCLFFFSPQCSAVFFFFCCLHSATTTSGAVAVTAAAVATAFHLSPHNGNIWRCVHCLFAQTICPCQLC